MVPYYIFLLALIILFLARFVVRGLGITFLSQVTETFLFLCVFLFSGLRYYVGYDYSRYVARVHMFGDYAGGAMRRELFSYYLTKIAYIMDEPQLFFFVNSFLTILLIFISLRRYSTDLNLSLWMFVCFPMFYMNSLSVVRSFAAVAVVFYGVRFIHERRLRGYVLTVLVAALFHNTAIVALPLYWLRDLKISRRLSFIILLASVGLEPVFSFLFVQLFPRYSVYILGGSMESGRYTLVVLWAIMIVALLLRDRLISLNYENQLYYNCYLFSVAFYSMLIRYGTIAHRGALYMYIYLLFLVPYMVQIIVPRQRVILRWIIYVMFVPMFLYMLKVGGDSYVPYEYSLDLFRLILGN